VIGQIKQPVVNMHTGENALATLRRFIGENFDWLVSQLGVAPLLSPSDDGGITRPVLSLSLQPQQQQPSQDTATLSQDQQQSQDTARLTEDFNPLNMFASIGNSQFNHVRTRVLSSSHHAWSL